MLQLILGLHGVKGAHGMGKGLYLDFMRRRNRPARIQGHLVTPAGRQVLQPVHVIGHRRALIGLVAASGSPLWLRLLSWVSGSTYGVDWPLVIGAGVVVVLLAPTVLALHRWLELLGLGAEAAAARGVRVNMAHLVLLTLAALATAVATLLVGPLSFVGLMAPHMARMLGLRRARTQLVGAAGIGVLVMVLADWVGRTLLVPHEWPAGLAAAFIGGLYFMWLLRRS